MDKLDKNRQHVIELITGIGAPKRTHYAELRAYVAQINRRNIQLEILNRVARSIRVDVPCKQVIRELEDDLKQLIPAPRAWVYGWPPDGENQFPGECPANRGQLSAQLQWVAGHQQPLFILPAKGDWTPPPCQWWQGNDAEAKVLVPLLERDGLIGILQISSPSASELAALGVRFFEQLADQLAVALVNHRLYLEVLQRQQEWTQTFEAIQYPLLVTDLGGKVDRCNRAARRFLPPDRPPTGMLWWQVLLGDVDDREPAAVTQAALAGQPVSTRLYDQEGRLFDLRAYPIAGSAGTTEGIIVAARDITDEVRYQAKVLHSARLAAIG